MYKCVYYYRFRQKSNINQKKKIQQRNKVIVKWLKKIYIENIMNITIKRHGLRRKKNDMIIIYSKVKILCI